MAESDNTKATPPPSAVIKLKTEAAAAGGDQSRVGMERTVSMDIRDEREDLKRAAEQSLNTILDLGLDGMIRWVSPSWQDVVGTPAESVIGLPIGDLITDNKTVFSDTMESMKQDDSRSQIIRFSMKVGPTSVLRPVTTDANSPDTPKPKDAEEEDDEEQKYDESDNDDAEPVVELEAQGIMIYNRTSGENSHTMWMIRPAIVREIKIDLPELLVESLGVGAEVLARHLTTLAEVGANDPSRHPPPMPVLCRICERQITPWWFEKHSDLCLQEHRAEMDVQLAHESLTEHRSSIVKVLDGVDAQSRQSRPSSGEIAQPLITAPEYKGIRIGSSSTPSSGPSSGRASPASPPSRSRDRSSSNFGHSRARSFAVRRPLTRIVELVLDLCDTSIEISTPAVNDIRGEAGSELRTQSPSSENRISQVLQWQSPGLSTLEYEHGLALLCEDTSTLAKSKVEAVYRYRGILEYSERIRVEFEVLVQECIEKAMRKAASIAAGDLSDSSDDTSGPESVRADDPTPFPAPTLTPARSPAEENFLAGSFEGPSAMAAALRNSSDPTLNLISFRRSSSAAASSRSSSPRGSKTPRSTAMSSVLQRSSIHAESDFGAESDAGSVVSSALSHSRRADSPSSDQGSLHRVASNRETDPKRRSLHLSGAMSNSRQQSPARSQLSSSPLRVSKPRIPSGSESVPSPITSPALGTGEFSSPVITAQHVHHHRRQSSATSSEAHRPTSPRIPATATHPQPRAVPVSIKDFEIIKPISKGAFGSVFLSKKKSTGEYYAIKVLKKADMIAKNQVTNVKAERAIMMWQGESDFVAKLYWTFSSKDFLYLVMEYLNGGDCASLIKVLGGLPEDWAKRYVAEVVLGVEHLHSRNIVHRDLKPDNLLIDQKGHLKLTDFGLSRMGLIGRQKRLLNSKSQEPVPDLLKSGPFQRNMSIASSRSASFDLQGTHSPNNTPDLTPAFTGDMGQPSYFSLNREDSNNRELSRRTSGQRSDSGDSDALSAFFRRFSMAEEPGRNRSPIEEETPQQENTSSSDPYLLQPTLSNHVPLHKESNNTPPPTSTMMPPPMALYDPQDSTRRFVGTPDYLAPETINGYIQDEVSDWWSLGCILFETLFGYPPFHADTPDEVFQNILSRKIDWPEDDECEVSEEAKDLMNRLMSLNPTERLGANTGDEYTSGGEEIRKHAWFNDVNWDTLRDDEASFIPAPGNPEDTEYFDSRGATLQNFADEFDDQTTSPGITPGADYPDRPHDALSRVRDRVNSSLKRTLMPLHIPPHVRDGRSRRLSEPVPNDDFGTFQFKNLPVLEKANKDVIQKLRAEAMQAQSKTSSGNSNATSPAVASPSPSLESSPMLPMPLKRTMSANKGHNRPVSPSVQSGTNCSPSRGSQPSSPLLVSFGTGQSHERRKTSSGSSNLSQPNPQSLQPGSFFEVPRLSNNFKTTSNASSPIKMAKGSGSQGGASDRGLSAQRQASGSQASTAASPRTRSLTVGSQEDNQHRETLPSHHKRRSQVLNDSPSSSDNEEQQRQKALLRVQRRRQSSRRLSQITLDGGPVFRPLDVLICEDHPVSRLVMEKLLEKLRCRTISVTNGSEAMRYAMSEVQFDIIMMEFKLPQMNGADVARMIRETKNANNHTPIVAVTGYLKDLQGPHHFDGMVEKPPTLAKLTDVLGKLCQWKPAPPGWSPAQASASSYPIPSGLRHQESTSMKMGDSPTSSSSGYVQPTSGSYRGSSREDSISSSFFGETDSMTSSDVPLIVSRQPTEEWRDRDIVRAFGGLGISDGSFPVAPSSQITSEPKEVGKDSNQPATAPPDGRSHVLQQQASITSAPMAHITPQISAPPVMSGSTRTPPRSRSPPKPTKRSALTAEAMLAKSEEKAPRKQPSAEKIAAKRRSFERERHESAESGDDEDEILGDERVRARSPKRRTSPLVTTTATVPAARTSSIASATGQTPRSSKLSTEMMRTNSQGSVISIEDSRQNLKNELRESSRDSQERIVEDVVAEEQEDDMDAIAPSKYQPLTNRYAETKSTPHTPERMCEEPHESTITPPEIFPKQPGDQVAELVDMDITPKPQHMQIDPDPTPRASGTASPSRFSRGP